MPALVCQSGARVENWRLHIQTAEAVYRPAAAVYRSAAEKGVDESTAVYRGLPSLPVDWGRRFITVYR